MARGEQAHNFVSKSGPEVVQILKKKELLKGKKGKAKRFQTGGKKAK